MIIKKSIIDNTSSNNASFCHEINLDTDLKTRLYLF